MIDNRLAITEDLVIILPVCLSITLIICYTLPTYLAIHVWSNSVDPDETPYRGVSSGSTLFATYPAIIDIIFGSELYLFKF